MTKVNVRRILAQEEARAILDFEDDAPEFTKHYPRHRAWLESALEDVLRGNRFAFGAYVASFGSDGRPDVTLAGCTIVKPGSYSSVVELKNLYVHNDYRRQDIGTELLERVEDYCARLGYEHIDVEVPCSEHGTVSFFQRRNYLVVETMRSPYLGTEYLYRLRRTMPTRYRGDIFDFERLCAWVLEHHYGLANVRVESTGITYSVGSSESKRLRIEGTAIVRKYDGRPVRGGDVHAQIEFLEHEDLAIGSHGGIRTISRATLLDELRSRIGCYVPRFGQPEICGAVVSLNPSMFDKIVARHNKVFTFIKSGPTGKRLQNGQRLFFYVEPTPRSPTAGIRAIASVKSVSEGVPSQIWNTLDEDSSLFSKDEFDQFCRNKHSIVAIKVGGWRAVPTVDMSGILQKLDWQVDQTEYGHLYVNDQFVKLFDASVQADKPAGRRGDLEESMIEGLDLAADDRTHILEALKSAFTYHTLQTWISTRFPEVSQDVGWGVGAMKYLAAQVLEQAAQHGVLDRLIIDLSRERPHRSDLRALVVLMCGRAWWHATPNTHGFEPKGWLETHTSSGDPFVSARRLAKWIVQIERQVCQVRCGESRGTGFLVGDDLVLTCHHVVASRIANTTTKTQVRFDYHDGAPAGRWIDLDEQWKIPHSPHSQADLTLDGLPTEAQLDYALLKLVEPVGAEQLDKGQVRGYVSLQHLGTVVAESPVLLVQHPMQEEPPYQKPLQVSFSTPGIEGLNANGTRIVYKSSTRKGSSGSPVFDGALLPIGLHHNSGQISNATGLARNNRGIPLEIIRAALHDYLEP